MLLQKLVEYSERMPDFAPPLYGHKWIRYVIELDSEGRLLNPEPVDLADEGSRQGRRMAVPNISRSSNISPVLFADHAEYTLGLTRGNPERTEKCHAEYISILKQCVTETEDHKATAVLRFFDNGLVSHLELSDDFKRGGAIVFRVDGDFVHTQPAVQRFWANLHMPKGGDVMQCLICGENKPVLNTLQAKVKGVPGGQTSGTALVTANASVFESYGLEQSHISPTCFDCGDRFTKVLNAFLRDESHHIWLRDMVFVFWAREPEEEFSFATFLTDPNVSDVRALYESPYSGKYNAGVDDTAFYAVSLSANPGRVIIRDWTDTTVGHTKESLGRWFKGQEVVRAWGEDLLPLSIFALVGATVRDLKDVPAPVYRDTIRSALLGTPLPWSLYRKAIRRVRIEREVTFPHVTLMKLVLVSQGIVRENEMTSLNREHPEAAYHCGRLFAVLEGIQRRGFDGKLNKTIKDRYFSRASMSPISVFPQLVRGATPHLSKIAKKSAGAAFAFECEMETIVDSVNALDGFPRVLDIQQQGNFVFGYYHQRAEDRRQALAWKEEQELGTEPIDEITQVGGRANRT